MVNHRIYSLSEQDRQKHYLSFDFTRKHEWNLVSGVSPARKYDPPALYCECGDDLKSPEFEDREEATEHMIKESYGEDKFEVTRVLWATDDFLSVDEIASEVGISNDEVEQFLREIKDEVKSRRYHESEEGYNLGN